jgi:hypothetical protein
MTMTSRRFPSPEDAANINSIENASHAPMGPTAPFYDWPIKSSYDFWLAHVRPSMGATFHGLGMVYFPCAGRQQHQRATNA